jgi:transcriptional regulator NrdR family protein
VSQPHRNGNASYPCPACLGPSFAPHTVRQKGGTLVRRYRICRDPACAHRFVTQERLEEARPVSVRTAYRLRHTE